MGLLAEHARSLTTNPTTPPRPPRRTHHPPKRAMPNRGNPKGRQTRCNLHSNLNGRPRRQRSHRRPDPPPLRNLTCSPGRSRDFPFPHGHRPSKSDGAHRLRTLSPPNARLSHTAMDPPPRHHLPSPSLLLPPPTLSSRPPARAHRPRFPDSPPVCSRNDTERRMTKEEE